MIENIGGKTKSSGGEPVVNRIADLLGDSVELVTEYRCSRHPQRVATSLCEFCGADLCSECANIRSRRIVCSGCMGALDKTFAGIGPASLFVRILTHPFVVAFILIALLGYLFVGFGQTHRRGLLGKTSGAGSPEEQFRLRMLLYARKADRIETHADALREISRYREATAEYDRARAVYETLAPGAAGRWESNVLTLARARLLQKMGERSYSEGLYKGLAGLPQADMTYAAIASFCLAKSQEETDPEMALQTYKSFLRNQKYVPDSLSRALNVMAHTEGAYNYESRLHAAARTDFDFEKAKVEAPLRMGRLLLALGRLDEARNSLRLALEEGAGTKLGEQATVELNKLRALEEQENPPKEEVEQEEKVVITHFD